jgi:Zn-dependent protease
MLLAEPPKTKLDVSFRLGSIPVRVHPFFWVAALLPAVSPRITLLGIAIWFTVVFVSILVHELGHALAFRRYGYQPRIALHALGGLATGDRTWAAVALQGRRQILVSAAGPMAGFAFGALVLVLVLQLGYRAPLWIWNIGDGATIPSEPLYILVYDLLFINTVWGLINLLPVHPLDGGQIAMELIRAKDPTRGIVRSLWLSVLTGIAIAIAAAIFASDLYLMFLFGYLAFASYYTLRVQFRIGVGTVWQRWRGTRRRKAIEGALVKDMRHTDDLENRLLNPEVVKVADEMLKSITEDIRRERDAQKERDKKS